MTRTILLAASALALAACGQQATQQAEAPTPPAPMETAVAAMSDADFVQAAANATHFEIQSSQLAATRSARQDVKDFATMMIRDHTQASEQLAALLPTLNIAAPTPTLDADLTEDIADQRGKTGAEFDDAYLDDQVEAHNNAVRLFETYLQSAPQGALRDWAQTTVVTLRTHRDRVQSLENAT